MKFSRGWKLQFCTHLPSTQTTSTRGQSIIHYNSVRTTPAHRQLQHTVSPSYITILYSPPQHTDNFNRLSVHHTLQFCTHHPSTQTTSTHCQSIIHYNSVLTTPAHRQLQHAVSPSYIIIIQTLGSYFFNPWILRYFKCNYIDVYWTVHHYDTWRIKNQPYATSYSIVLLIGSTCFAHYYAHHQDLVTIMLIATLVVSFLVCCMLEFRCCYAGVMSGLKVVQPATRIPPQTSHTETPTNIETRTHD